MSPLWLHGAIIRPGSPPSRPSQSGVLPPQSKGPPLLQARFLDSRRIQSWRSKPPMNPTALELVRWPRRRWVYAVATVFLLQAGLVFLLGHRKQRVPEPPIFRTAIHMQTDLTAPLDSLPGMEDPTLLALPSLRGFSGPAWLRFPPLEYQPAEWVEPPHWLALDTNALSATFSRFIRTNVISPPLIADKPLPPLPGYEPNFPNEPLPSQSQLRLEGDLAGRRLLAPLELQSWPHSEILSNTTVQAAVDAAGFTFSAVLLAGSGLKEADQFALKLASSARFRPLPRGQRAPGGLGPVTWGRFVFQWHTLPLPATNLSSAQP